MTDKTIITLVGSLFIVACYLGWFLGKSVWYGGWDKRGRHKCGHVAPIAVTNNCICPKCGEQGNWENVNCRLRYPGYMEFKP